jgi:hypothetical protein
MKRIYEFYVETKYIGSRVVEEVELEFDDDATEQEIEKEVDDIWTDWRSQNSDGGWILKE